MTFHEESKWFLLLLPVAVALIWWRWAAQGRHASLRFSSLDWFIKRGTTFKSRARILVPILRTLAVALLIVCLARPQKGNEESRILAEGVGIQAIVDVSGSMEALDFNLGGKQVNRLEAIKKVFREFVLGGGDLKGRPDDLIGLIAFAGFADTKAPLTLDHATVLDILDQTETVMSVDVQKRYWRLKRDLDRERQISGSQARQRELTQEISLIEGEDGTAIGDALGLAVNNLRELERRRGVSDEKRIKSKIMVLMTDGANNAGDLAPAQAAQMAAAFGFKVYCIGVGTGRQVLVPQYDPFSGSVQLRQQRFPIDEKTMQTVAEETGGKYFRADDTDALRQVYAEIDRLEKTETEEKKYRQYRELATESIKLGKSRLPPLLALALAFSVLEMGLAHTLFRKAP